MEVRRISHESVGSAPGGIGRSFTRWGSGGPVVTAVQSLPTRLGGDISARPSSESDRWAGGRSDSAHRSPAAFPSTAAVAGVLPKPPDDQEKHSYVQRHLWVLVCCSVVSFGCLALAQLRLALSTPWMWLFLPLLLFTILYYVISLSVNALSRDFDLPAHRRLCASWNPVVYPDVDVFLPVCGEPLDVIKNTWAQVDAMAQFYQGVVTVYVLDDMADQAIAATATEFSFTYRSRSNRGWFKKAGNLRYGFQLSSGDYILVLDADFAPRYDLLNELLPYMERESANCNCPVATVLPSGRPAELDRARSGGGAGALLPLYSGFTTTLGRGDMRWQLRHLPAGRSPRERRPDAYRALRRCAYRLRPSQAWLGAALCANRPGHRLMPGYGRGLPGPAVPVVLRFIEPAEQ